MDKKIKNYVLVSHVFHSQDVPIYGPIHALQAYLADKQEKVSWLYLPLELAGEIRSKIEDRDSSENIKNVVYQNLILKIFSDILQVFYYIFQVELTPKTRVIAADPLSCLPFALVKVFFGFNLIYYTVDYSNNRFNNGLLNLVYGWIDKFCLAVCDQNWCVSNRICQKRIDDGAKEEKIKFVPNTPVLKDKPKIQSSRRKFDLIYVGRMDKSMSVLSLIKVVAQMKPTFPKLKLTMIGGGKDESKILEFIEEFRLGSVIEYLGPLPNEKVIARLKKSGIGLALYSGDNSWNEYGDSMKIREYHHFGLPAITTKIPANSEEVAQMGSGVVITSSQIKLAQIKRSLEKVIQDYDDFSKAANILAIKYQKQKIFDSLLT